MPILLFSKRFLALLFLLLYCLPALAQQVAAPFEFVPAEKGVELKRAQESFSAITLQGSELTADVPLLAEKTEGSNYVRELLQVKWRPNDAIDLYVIRPRGVQHPPVAIYLYGFPSETDRFKDDEYCKRVVKGGTAVVGFVSALTGHRIQGRPLREWFISELPESLAVSTHDVQMVLNYLATRGDFDMTRVGMYGNGSGAAITILAAAADPRIKVLDLLDPWASWPEWLAASAAVPAPQRSDFLTPNFLAKLQPLEPLNYLPKLSSRSIRIQLLDDDNVNSPKNVARKVEEASPATAAITHYTSRKALMDVSAAPDDRLFLWMSDQLKSGNLATSEQAAGAAILKH